MLVTIYIYLVYNYLMVIYLSCYLQSYAKYIFVIAKTCIRLRNDAQCRSMQGCGNLPLLENGTDTRIKQREIPTSLRSSE